MKIHFFFRVIALLFIFFFTHQVLYSSEILSVQVGAFSSEKYAQNLVKTLKDRGIKCLVHETEGLYKVYCGEFSRETDANALKNELYSLGYDKTFIVSKTGQPSQDTTTVDSSTRQVIQREATPPIKERTDEKPPEHVREEPEYHAAVSLDRVVAVVNKEVITWSELYKMMEHEATDQTKALKEEERMNIFKDNEAFFLGKLIDLRLQIQEAKRLGLGATPEEMTEAIENIKKKYSLTDNALRESLKKEGLTFEEYRKRLSEQITVSKLVSQQIRSKIVISDEEVKKYMEENKKSSGDSETLRLRQIFFKRPENDADKKAIEDKADLIIQKLKAGEDFSALAKEYSEDPSRRLGGDLGFMKRSHLAKEFIDVLNTMKTGDFSIPFWSEKGLHIVKLEEKISAQSIDEVKEDIRNQLAEDRFSGIYKNWIKGLREKAYIEIRL
jgi:peptidyl-prolyl cis-trans isomerase SurA